MPSYSSHQLTSFRSIYDSRLEGGFNDDDIIVTGNPPEQDEQHSSLYHFVLLQQLELIEAGGQPTVDLRDLILQILALYIDLDPSNTPTVTTEVTNEENRADVEAARDDMQSKINIIDRMVDQLADDATVPWPDGTTKTGAEVKALWAAMDFRVSDRDFGPGRVGEVVGTLSTINFAAWNGYSSQGAGTFIVLHELVHTDPSTRAYIAAAWVTFYNSELASYAATLGKSVSALTAEERQAAYNIAVGRYTSNSSFEAGEHRANQAARALSTMLNIPLPDGFVPTHGW